MFNITAGSTRDCDEIDIVDDSTVESTEKFRIVLDPPVTPIDAKLGDRPAAEVTIIDDDSKYIAQKNNNNKRESISVS